MELPIQESSPASEMMDSLGSSVNSSTGMVVPVMRDCMGGPRGKYTSPRHSFPFSPSFRYNGEPLTYSPQASGKYLCQSAYRSPPRQADSHSLFVQRM